MITGVRSQGCIEGEIEVTVNRPNFAAGRISICNNNTWNVICHHGWDIEDARVACRQLGFPAEGKSMLGPQHLE